MMLERLRVRQYRCFEDLTLNPQTPDGNGGGWTILVGENGVGKSSLLQSVVLGLLDPRPLTSLDKTPWSMCRQGMPKNARAEIEVDLRDANHLFQLKKTVENQHGAYLEDRGDALPSPPLTLAFSARRRIARPGEIPESENHEVERVRGLFDPNLPLLAHDAFNALHLSSDRRAFANVVRDVVVHRLDHDERMFPLVDAIQLAGRGGVTTSKQLLEQQRFVLLYGSSYQVRVAVEELSDGYQAMLSIILEILTQAVIATGQVPETKTLSAIVLIDEIEAHLHPRWQRTVVPLLREVFPACQFIVTTHSPLVVGSARKSEVQVLEVHEQGDVRVQVLEERLEALDADEIYEAVFGVPRAAPQSYVEDERLYLESLVSADVQVTPEIRRKIEAAWEDRDNVIGTK